MFGGHAFCVKVTENSYNHFARSISEYFSIITIVVIIATFNIFV